MITISAASVCKYFTVPEYIFAKDSFVFQTIPQAERSERFPWSPAVRRVFQVYDCDP